MTPTVREQLTEYARRHPDAPAPAILGALGVDPTEEHVELAREAVAARGGEA